MVCVPEDTWNALLKRITGTEQMIIGPVRKTEHFLYSQAYEVIPDEQGRVVIPEKLAIHAQLSEEVCFLGVGDRVEIWDRKIWEAHESEISKEAAAYIEELAKKK